METEVVYDILMSAILIWQTEMKVTGGMYEKLF